MAKIEKTCVELKADTEKFVTMAQEQDIFISSDGKVVAKLVAAKPDKVPAKSPKELLELIREGT